MRRELLELVLSAPVRPEPVSTPIAGGAILFGWSIKEATGVATAELAIRNGQDSSGLLAFPITLNASECTQEWFGPQGVRMDNGIFPGVVSGAVVGCLLIADPWWATEESRGA